jgi:hypothetical protein
MAIDKRSQHTLEYWLDAFFTLCEVSVETAANADGLMDGKPASIDMENLNARRMIWKRVKSKFGTFGQECYPTEIGIDGLEFQPTGEVAITKEKVAFYRNGDPVPVVLEGDEVTVSARFMQFYNSMHASVDPSMFIRGALEKNGITKDNFYTHPNSPSAIIKNPFTDEED